MKSTCPFFGNPAAEKWILSCHIFPFPIIWIKRELIDRQAYSMNKTALAGPSLQRAGMTLLFLLLTILILTHSQTSLLLASNSLNLWFSKMVPSLLPFLILSGVMVRMQLTENFASVLYPALYPLFRVSKNVIYAIIMGFLCGFPMGARVTCELLERGRITRTEGEFLLAFCNNIGPVYFCSFVLPLLHRRLVLPYLMGMYGLPLLYGMFLRRTVYRGRLSTPSQSGVLESESALAACELVCCENRTKPLSLLEQVDDSISAGVQGILMLGGYMILFQLFNLFPVFLKECALRAPSFLLPVRIAAAMDRLPLLAAPVLEITGGLGMLGDCAPLLSLVLLPFGGLSCIAQTYSTIKRTSLSISHYVTHKLILTGITLAYYGLWALLSPHSFLV